MTEKIRKTKERLALYYQAEKAILLRQKYKIGTKELTMADLNIVRQQINTLEAEVDALEKNNGKRKVKRIIPLDI